MEEEVETLKNKSKPGCFMHCWERVGKRIRRLTRRRKSRNSVSPAGDKPVSIDDNKLVSGRNQEEEQFETRKTSNGNNQEEPELRETDTQHRTRDNYDESMTNDSEKGLDEFAENFVQSEMERISSLFLVNSADEKENDQEVTADENY